MHLVRMWDCALHLTAWGWLPSTGATWGSSGDGDGWPATGWGMGPGDGRPAAGWGMGLGPGDCWLGDGAQGWPACGGMGDGACTRPCQVVGSSVFQLTDGSPSAICWISSNSCVDTFSWDEDGPLIIIIITSIITMINYDFIS